MINRIFAIFTLVITGVFFYESQSFSEKTGMQTFAPSFFPRIILFIMAMLATVLLLQSFIKPKNSVKIVQALKIYFIQQWRVPTMLLCFFLYLLIIPLIGFFASTVLFLLAGFLLLRPLKITNVVTSVMLTFALSFIIQFIFQKGLNIYLP